MNPEVQKELDAAKKSIDWLVNQLTLPTREQNAVYDALVHIYTAVKLLAENLPTHD